MLWTFHQHYELTWIMCSFLGRISFRIERSFTNLFLEYFHPVKSNKIQDCVFWYKATIRKNFRVGGPDLWRLHKKMYNPKHLQQKEDDAKKATKKTNLKITKTK